MLIQGFAIAHVLAVIVFSSRILLRDDLAAESRLAWFLVMLFTPYLGVMLYLLFGEISLGRTVHQQHNRIFDKLHEIAGAAMGSCDRNLAEHVEREFHTAFRAASVDGFETTIGNRAELLPDAKTARSRLIEDIDKATDCVQVLYYIWLDDNTGTNVARALIRAAERGVTVHAMADGLGSYQFVRSKWWRDMRDAGVNLRVALPLRWVVDTILFSRIDLRALDSCLDGMAAQGRRRGGIEGAAIGLADRGAGGGNDDGITHECFSFLSANGACGKD